MSRTLRSWRQSTALLALLMRAGLAHAATPSELEQADAHFKQGVQLFKAGIYDAALVEFRKAQTIVPDWHVLFNIGRTCSELHEPACAISAYRSYLRDGEQIPSARVAELRAEIARLEPSVGLVHVSASEPQAELTLDDRPLDRDETLSGVVVNIGRHRFSARFPDGTVDSRVLDVASGDDVTVWLVAPRAPTAAAPSTAPPRPLPERSPTSARFPVWAGWVASSAFAAGGTIGGLLALSSRRQAQQQAADLSPPSKLDATNAQMHSRAAVTDALFGAAAVCGAVTLYFTLKTPARPAPSQARVALDVAPGALRLGYRF